MPKCNRQRKFKVLFTGNFYFPIKDKGKEFIVEDTIDIIIDKKYNKIIESSFIKNNIWFHSLAIPIWEACKKELKTYKNCWIVPIYLQKMGTEYKCTIDILKKPRKDD